MRLRTLLPVMLALAVFPVSGDVIYKWKSDAGETQYGQFPPVGVKSELISAGVAKPVPQAESGDSETAAPGSLAPDSLQLPDQAEQPEQTSAAEPVDEAGAQEDRKQKCASARGDLEVLQSGGHHRMRLPDGTITYLDAGQTAQRIAAAKQHVEVYCN